MIGIPFDKAVIKFTEAKIELYETIKVQDITTLMELMTLLVLPTQDDSPGKDPSGNFDLQHSWAERGTGG